MSENEVIYETAEKPSDWPANEREARLENVLNAVKKFKENPNYENKQVLVSLVSQVDLNEHSNRGCWRISEYEVEIINSLYIEAALMGFFDLKLFLYKQIANTARIQNICYNMGSVEDFPISAYKILHPLLYLFYQIYANYTLEKERSFPDQLIHEVNLIRKEDASPKEAFELSRALNMLLLDLSHFSSAKVFWFLRWTRQELKKIFALQANLIKKTKQNPLTRPLLGCLNITISNWILKSRNDYNEDALIKYLPDSINLNEIWMQEIKNLNDKREGVVINEIYKTKDWVKFEWAKKVNLTPVWEMYVSSFSKTSINPEMQNKYGKNAYGYKSDNIGALLSPIRLIKDLGPFFYNATYFDVIYDIDEAKNEINFLCEIIELYDISVEDKNAFLNKLIQYWLLSFKDKKWENEKERRYQITFDTDYDYAGAITDEKYLKIKSLLFTFPDFVSKDNNNKVNLMLNKIAKLAVISTRPYIFCHDCLHADYDNLYDSDKEKKCSLCGSDKVQKMDEK